jgi:undecaprenyl-diphosphatase
MEALKVIFLGVIQGITEFLPVSSSGHLVIAGHLLDIKGDSILMNIFLHLGTLTAIVVVYRHDLCRIWRDERRMIFYIVIATVPVVAAALFAGEKVEACFENVDSVGYFMVLTGLFLIAGRYADKKLARKKSLSWGRSIAVGIAQALSLLPGVSRSGSTISTGMIFGMDRDKAARFAFLIAVPAIFGAVAKKTLDLLISGHTEDFNMTLPVGMVTSAIVGYFALRLLLRMVHRGNLAWFSLYCFLVGICTIIYGVLG